MNKNRYEVRPLVFETPRALTGQERRVVAELARGLSNRQIARVMALSEHTIKFHLKNVFTKLGVRSRMQVIIHAASANPEMSSSRAVSSFAPTEIPTTDSTLLPGLVLTSDRDAKRDEASCRGGNRANA